MDTYIILALLLVLILFYILVIILTKTNNKLSECKNVQKIDGNFTFLNSNSWKVRPLIPVSENTILATSTFPNDNYDINSKKLPLLYGGRNISVNEAIVIKGNIPTRLNYWSFGVFKLTDGVLEQHKPVEMSINNNMTTMMNESDDIVCIMSPNYKLAEHVANIIKQGDYPENSISKKQVMFRYFPIPDYSPNDKYTLLFEGFAHPDCSLPIFDVSMYKYNQVGKISNFPYEKIVKSDPVVFSNGEIIVEEENSGGVDFMIDKIVKDFPKSTTVNRIIISKESKIENNDILYTDSGPIDIKNCENVIVGAVDHTANGKCIYSEIIFVDDKTGKVFDTYNVGVYNETSVEPKCKVKLIKMNNDSFDCIRIIEKICIDRNTFIKPEFDTIIPATIFITSKY